MEQPDFIERDFEKIKERMLERVKEKTGKELQEADPEYVVLEQAAYEIYIQRCAFQDVGLQNLLDFARYPLLDYLGAMRNCARLTDESDDAYRERIRESMNAYTVCGTEAAYRYIGGHAHESIIDINPYSVLREVNGENIPAGIVEVYVLTDEYWTQTGYEAETDTDKKAAMDAVLTAVKNALNPVDVRPLGEEVRVLFPEKKEAALEVKITAKRTASATLKTDIEQALSDYLKGEKDAETGNIIVPCVKNKISNDIVISQIIGVCQAVSGVYNVTCSPDTDFPADYNEFIRAEITVAVTGVTDERE